VRLWARGRCVERPHRRGGRVRVSGGACAVSVGAVSGAERKDRATKTSKHLEAAGGAYRAEMLALVRV
jgi:hypothetical protein